MSEIKHSASVQVLRATCGRCGHSRVFQTDDRLTKYQLYAIAAMTCPACSGEGAVLQFTSGVSDDPLLERLPSYSKTSGWRSTPDIDMRGDDGVEKNNLDGLPAIKTSTAEIRNSDSFEAIADNGLSFRIEELTRISRATFDDRSIRLNRGDVWYETSHGQLVYKLSETSFRIAVSGLLLTRNLAAHPHSLHKKPAI